MTIDEIRQLVRADRYEVSIHAQQERLEDDLDINEIETALLQGELIEEYPNDPAAQVVSSVAWRGLNRYMLC